MGRRRNIVSASSLCVFCVLLLIFVGLTQATFKRHNAITMRGFIPTRGIPVALNGSVPTYENGMVPTDENGMVPTDENGMVPTDENGMVPTDENGLPIYDMPKGSLTRPFTWEELVTVISIGEDALKRWRPNQIQYRSTMRKVKAMYHSVEDYILISKFNYKSEIDEKGQLVAIPHPDIPPPEYVLCLNDFPYAVEHDVQHLLLWALREIPREEAKQIIDSHFSESQYDVIYFINPPSVQTVKKIHHWQIFVRPKRAS